VEPARSRGSLVGLFSADDYPSSAQSAGAEGTVRASIVVGPDGRVQSCNVVQSSGNGSLDSATCNIIRRRAKFTPARDSNGQAVTDTVQSPPIVWRLEG
jgi:protein TonB